MDIVCFSESINAMLILIWPSQIFIRNQWRSDLVGLCTDNSSIGTEIHCAENRGTDIRGNNPQLLIRQTNGIMSRGIVNEYF